MLRPAHLLSTAVLAAVAIPLLETVPETDHMQSASKASQAAPTRLSVPASTISSGVQSMPTQVKRWVF